MKRKKTTCAENKKRYSCQAEHKRAVKEIARVKAARRLNRELQAI